MKTAFFLQSEVKDPYALYHSMLHENPVFRDQSNHCWITCSYKDCKSILTNPAAHIPAVDLDGMNDYALAIAGRLTRLSNPPQHALNNQVARHLFHYIQPAPIQDMMDALLPQAGNNTEMDWVAAICKKIPVACILKGYGFSHSDCESIAAMIERFTRIMLPVKTKEQVQDINATAKAVYTVIRQQVLQKGFPEKINSEITGPHHSMEEILQLCISNLAGLLVQSYDAGRGLLSNALLHFLLNGNMSSCNCSDKNYISKCVTETLRFDPPIHNTRRIASAGIYLGDHIIKNGETILVVLAAANRDPQQFTNPGIFDSNRNNNADHLTFGAGTHHCLASRFSTHITTETLYCLFQKYTSIQLTEKNISYEPLLNARLPKKIMITVN